MSFFKKDINNICKEDIEKIIDLGLPENESIEFKKTLSTANGQPDNWIVGKNKVGKFAKEKLVKEIIAFANSDGGYLLVGIDEKESREGISKASKIFEIPRVELLAEKFKMYLRDHIEPRISNVQCLGIRTDDDGKGVLIIFVEKSNNAPHRSTLDNQCYIRRNDRSEKMTMREIRDLILLSNQSIERVEDEFRKRKEIFRKKFLSLEIPVKTYRPMKENRIGFRCTLLPVNGNISIPNIYKKIDSISFIESLKLSFDSGNPKEDKINFPSVSLKKYPVIRGVIFWDDKLTIELRENGLIEIHLIYERDLRDAFYLDWYILIIFNGISLANKLCEIISSNNMEYGIEAELISTQGEVNPGLFENIFWTDKKVNCPVSFPRYSYANDREMNDLLNLMAEDFYNMCEKTFNNSISLSNS